jgi:hypothetical protein
VRHFYSAGRRYERSPSLLLKDSTGVPIFLPMALLKKLRTEFGFQPVSFASSFRVTPSGRLSRSRILSVLLPPWAAVAGLFALAACGAGSAFRGAGLAFRLATRGFVVRLSVLFFFLAAEPGVDFYHSSWEIADGYTVTPAARRFWAAEPILDGEDRSATSLGRRVGWLGFLLGSRE